MNAEFRTHFAKHIGAISGVFRATPGIDTGHDGCDIWLYSPDGLWVVSAQPELDKGHLGVWRISMAPRKGDGWGQWETFKVSFDTNNDLVS